MPKGKAKLAHAQIVALTQWVAQGTPWPTGQPKVQAAYAWAKVGAHWAFTPVLEGTPPIVEGAQQHNAIDQFVAARRQAAGLPEPASASAPAVAVAKAASVAAVRAARRWGARGCARWWRRPGYAVG